MIVVSARTQSSAALNEVTVSVSDIEEPSPKEKVSGLIVLPTTGEPKAERRHALLIVKRMMPVGCPAAFNTGCVLIDA